MASINRYRSGDAQKVPFKSDASYPAEISDLVFVHPATGAVRPASAVPNQNNTLVSLQEAFVAYFAGVATRKTGVNTDSYSGLKEPIWQLDSSIDPGYNEIATAGVYEYDCPATIFAPGDLVGPYGDSGGKALSNQKVMKVTTDACAIGVAIVPASLLGKSQTTIMVKIRSTVMQDGLQPNPDASTSGSGQ